MSNQVNQHLLEDVVEAAEIDTSPQSCITPTKNVEDSSEPVIEASDLKKANEPETLKLPRYIISGVELMNKQVEEMPTLLQPYLPKVGIAVLVGSSDTGKSSFLRKLATAVALGDKAFLGFILNLTHQSAIYISTEDDEDAVANLMQKQNGGKRLDEKFEGLRYIFENEKLVEMLTEELGRQRADVVIIDTLTDVFGTNDFNSATAVRHFFKHYQQLANKHKCLFIFNHHVSKSKDNGVPSKNAVLGSSGIESRARVLLELRKDRFDSTLRHLIVLKGNYLHEDLKQKSIVLKFDEHMCFSNTGNTCPIEELSGNKNFNAKDELVERSQQLKKEGLSVRKIVAKLNEETGVNVGKTSVAEWVKEASKSALIEPKETEEQSTNELEKS